jgi:catechol 2,3-dioxygenase
MPASNQIERAPSVRLRSIGHVVLNVRSLAVSTPFYCKALGLKEAGRNEGLRMVFLSFGIRDHDIGLCESQPAAHPCRGPAAGLGHVAFLIGGGLDELRRFKAHLEARGVAITHIDEHIAGTSIYFSDPDGIELEAFVENPAETWRDKQGARFVRSVRLD